MHPPPFIYLASQSPRRRELLQQVGIRFRLLEVHVDESRRNDETARQHVLRLAAEKAVRGWGSLPAGDRAPVLGADTVVVIDGDILGKPAGPDEAGDMLARLSGRTHEVLSSVCITDGTPSTRLSRSLVTFREISDAERAAYCATSEPLDKAGAYAIQGRAAAFVSSLQGSYSGVMGLPLFETAELLFELGIDLLEPH
ncbi:MAG TPA: Maf family protein [Gammaproteobacteria bacterium]|nr:Maf family protein [Gammaproteobacteria bacterium]